MVNSVDTIWRHAQALPHRTALGEGKRVWSYDELARAITTAAELLQRRGVGRGDLVLMVVPTCTEFVVVYHGLLALGPPP